MKIKFKNKINRFLQKSLISIYDKKLPPSKPTEIELIKQLKARILELRKDPNPPPLNNRLARMETFC